MCEYKMSSESEFKSVNVRRNVIKVTKFNGEVFTTKMSSNLKAFEYANQLVNYLPETHVHTSERGDGIKWEKTVFYTPITFHHFQKSGDGWQQQSAETIFLHLTEEDEEYYYREQNCCVGDYGIQKRIPKEIFDRLEKEGGKYFWSSTSDTQTWETEVSEHVTINGECVWDNSYTEQK